MKILAIEVENTGVPEGQFKFYLKAEAARVWQLHQDGIIRELYFRQDQSSAILILECANAEGANEALATLPRVQRGLIRFEIIPLIPYPGFARLFEKK